MHIDARTIDRSRFQELFLTAGATAPAGVDRVHAAYGRIAASLTAARAERIAEKVYGSPSARAGILAARSAALREHGLDDTVPVTFVGDPPAGGGECAGIQVWAVGSRDRQASVRTVPGGRLWSAPGVRALHLAGVRGAEGGSVTAQAEGMFAAAAAAADAHGFTYDQTVRTWIYLARLLDWYDELNRVRTAFYRRYGFAYPASTGIQGLDGPSECQMDVLLVDGVTARTIDHSARQDSAVAYGSAFSRAVVMEFEGGRTVHVSGTASIDAAGRSVHEGDPTAQFAATLLNVAALLDTCGMSLEHIVQATLFCKDAAAHAACQEAWTLRRLPRFPTVCVIADVCRPELLVEMEAVAVA